MPSKVIIGYGTGRCGTKSLAEFLSRQPGVTVTHESVRLAWYPGFTDTTMSMYDFLTRPGEMIGDVGFYWINYLDLVLRTVPGAKAINIQRDLEEVIESFWSYRPEKDQYVIGYGWYGYPFDSDVPTKDAIHHSVKRYRAMERLMQKVFPFSIWTMPMSDLNDMGKMAELLDWLGITGGQVLEPVHVHTREEVISDYNRNAQPHVRLLETFRRATQ